MNAPHEDGVATADGDERAAVGREREVGDVVGMSNISFALGALAARRRSGEVSGAPHLERV